MSEADTDRNGIEFEPKPLGEFRAQLLHSIACDEIEDRLVPLLLTVLAAERYWREIVEKHEKNVPGATSHD